MATDEALIAKAEPSLAAAEEEAVAAAAAEEAKKVAYRVSTQDFLLRNMGLISDAHRGAQYKDITRVTTDEPATILNRLMRRDSLAPLFNIKPAQIAGLVPKIKLYLVYRGSDAEKKDNMVELQFPDRTSKESIENITKSRFGRGDGVGIKGFSVETQGTNPAEGALVKCTLQVFFQNIEMLASQSRGEEPSENDYIELILRRTKDPKKKSDSKGSDIPYSRSIVNRFGFRLMAVIGWAVPKEIVDDLDDKLKETLRQSKQTIYLNLIDHTIDFKQDGTAELTCEYQGALERILSDEEFYDVLKVPEEGLLFEQLREVEKELDKKRKEGAKLKDDPAEYKKQLKKLQQDVEKLKKLKKKYNKGIRALKHAQIINRLYVPRPPNPTRIGTIDITPEQAKELKEGKKLSAAAAAITQDNIKIDGTDSDIRAANSNRAQKLGATATYREGDPSLLDYLNAGVVKYFKDLIEEKRQEDTRLSFIYFGDLVDVMMESIRRSRDAGETAGDAGILLGPVSYNEQLPNGTVEVRSVNLADVPISLKSFEFWFNKNVTKQKLDSWPLRSFLKSAVSELVLNALGEHTKTSDSIRRDNVVGIHSFLARKKNGQDPIPENVRELNLDTVENRLFPADAERDKIAEMKPYILVYASIEKPGNRDPSNAKKDLEEGIYHFYIGSDRGLLKSVNFRKTDVQFLKEARHRSQDTEDGQLRDKYDATLELIGSSFLFAPGQKIYINPTLTGFGSITSRKSMARMLGLGGYYDIIKVNTRLSRDMGYTTTLDCAWNSFGKVIEPDEEPSATAPATTPVQAPGSPGTAAANPAARLGDPPGWNRDIHGIPPTDPAPRTPQAPTEEGVADKLASDEAEEKAKTPTPPPPPDPEPVQQDPWRQANKAEQNAYRQKLTRVKAKIQEKHDTEVEEMRDLMRHGLQEDERMQAVNRRLLALHDQREQVERRIKEFEQNPSKLRTRNSPEGRALWRY